jgi:hypothetical protein
MATTKAERNYQANASDIDTALKVFRKTDGMETLIQHLAAFLTPDQFRMLWVLELNKIPLEIVYVDKDGNKIEEKESANV